MTTDLKNILLAEDSEQDIELTLEALRENNLANDVVVVRDGEQALDYLYARGEFRNKVNGLPAVILLDLKMPKVDGMEVLRTIRGDAKLRELPVVILTSSREERDLVEAYGLGVNAFVVKPVDFHEFLNAVKALGVFWALVNEPPHGIEKKRKL
ncbi:MAG TPA: response regulator [Bacteroidota bacterium]|nr:response regulator [Bacteroidota bacterium]